MEWDPFLVLGVERGASWEEIRRAYLRRVREVHPDKGGDVEEYLKVQESYEKLKSAYEKRKRVQVIRERPVAGNYFLSFVELSVVEAALGAEKWVKVPDETVVCEGCGGSGKNLKGRVRLCEWCRGEGLVSEDGSVFKHPCPMCKGEGKVYLEMCPKCRGKGEVRKEKDILVVVPAGVKEGDLLFVPTAPDGPSVDVFLEVLIRRDEEFYFEEEDVVAKVKVPFWKAALGGRVKVKTLEGEEEIEVSPGLPSGSRLILNNRGPFKADGKRGSLILEFEVWFPKEYPPEAMRLLQKFYEIMEENYGGTSGVKQ